jgi:hypothetical protein
MVNMKQKDKGNEAQGLLLLYYEKKIRAKVLGFGTRARSV